MTKQIITAETVRLAWKAGESVIVYAKGDIVTQQAQDDARHNTDKVNNKLGGRMRNN